MDDDGEDPFVPLDSLLEVNLVEDTSGRATTLTKTDSFKDCIQGNRPDRIAEDAVNSTVSYAKSTGLNNATPSSNLDPVQIAWGMCMEEDLFYKDLFTDVLAVQYLRLHCTVCDTHLGCNPGSVLMRHVRLGTLLCKDCFTFYGTGEFPVAEDGSESFCYWCGQGGSVICCSSCSAVFCKKCIKLNYTRSTFKEIETSQEWLCFVCNYRSLWEHRAVCRAAITYESSCHGSLKGAEEKQTPGHNQEFCCGPSNDRRIPRLKSSMPSEVTFGEYIKAGRVKTSIIKMLRNVSMDSNEGIKTEKIISTDSQKTDSQKSLTHSTDFKEMGSSELSVAANRTNKERVQTYMASHNISYVDVRPLISQANFSSINSQPATGLQFLNQGMRPNIISSSQTMPSGRVVLMPPVHIPHHSSVIRFPQQNLPVDALSLGALLSSSPPVGSVPQPSNPVFRFQSRTSPLVVVRKTSGGYMPMYINNSANFNYLPKESSQISGLPPYVQNQGTNVVINHPSQQREKPENSIHFPHSSVLKNATTYKPNINGHTSQNLSEATLAHTANSCANSSVKPKSKTKSGYIQVRSPTALQSVTVSDIVHSPLAVSELDTCVGTEQLPLQNSLFSASPSASPLAPRSLAKDQSVHNSLPTESHLKNPENKPTSRLVSSITNLEATSVLKSRLSDVSSNSSTSVTGTSSSKEIPQTHVVNQMPSRSIDSIEILKSRLTDLLSNPSTSVNGTSSNKEIPQAHVVNQICPELPSRSIDAFETKWFKENLFEAENVAKYILTRVTCVQEELDSKSHQKQEYDDMINNFNKLLETAGKKLADVNRNFTANLERWKASHHTDLSQGPSANTDQQSSVETMKGHNNIPRDEVEVISVKVGGKRKRSNSGSQVTCTKKPGLASVVAKDATSSGICAGSSDNTHSKVTKPINTTYQPTRMFTRRSKATKPAMKCCSGCEPDQQLKSKQLDSKQNMGSSCVRSERLRPQENFICTQEKREKLKDLRIILERIPNPGKTVFKRELNDTHSTSNSNEKLLVQEQSCLEPDDPVKRLKPCSVVIERLNERDITHCI